MKNENTTLGKLNVGDNFKIVGKDGTYTKWDDTDKYGHVSICRLGNKYGDLMYSSTDVLKVD